MASNLIAMACNLIAVEAEAIFFDHGSLAGGFGRTKILAPLTVTPHSVQINLDLGFSHPMFQQPIMFAKAPVPRGTMSPNPTLVRAMTT